MIARKYMEKLWSKNFTIITLGTVVSALGNAISAFSIALIVLGYTQSTFLFAVFQVVYNLPKIVMPLIVGPYMDRFSRSRVIYSLDFLSSALYLFVFVLLFNDLFIYGVFLFLAFIIGCIDGTYQVAYDSLYPTLVSEKNYSKAYSISSIIYPLSSVTVLVAAFLYDHYGAQGLAPLFLFNTVCFFIAAAFETQIRAPETYIPVDAPKFSLAGYRREFVDGLRYINGERGLKVITAYFFLCMLAFAASGVVVLPYFMAHENLRTTWYTYVMAGGVIGRLIGGGVLYNFKYSAKIRFALSVGVYIALSFLEGTYLFFPALVMIGMQVVSGILSVTSFNIRTAATQSYVPNEFRGRFNGTFQMICTLGTILGQLLAGAMADFFSGRIVLAAFMGVNLVAVLMIMVPWRRDVSMIYNRDV